MTRLSMPRLSMLRFVPLAAFLALGLLCLSCRPSEPAMKLEHRFIGDDLEPIPEKQTAVYQRESAIKWTFGKSSDLAGWIAHDFDMKFELSADRGLLMQSSMTDSCLWRPVDFDADEIDEIQIIRSPLTGDTVQFFWQGEDDPTFTDTKSLWMKYPDPGGKLVQTFTFKLRGNPNWKGRIRYLRFDFTELPKHRVALFSIEAFRYRLDPAQLARMVTNPMRINLSNREYLARLAPPGLPWDRPVKIPKGARLTFAYGLQQRMGVPITFKTSFETAQGKNLLFSASLDPATQGRVWQEKTIELGSLAGQEGKIVFETEAPPEFDPLRGLPAWGNPEIAAPGDTDKWNVVWIVVDTLRADRLSAYGYPHNTSPNLEAFARKRGVVFSNTIAAAPWTLPSHVSMFTGLSALSHGINYRSPAPASLQMIAEHLRGNGYSTLAVTGGAFLSTNFGLSQGFDRFSYVKESDKVNDPSGSKDLPTTLATATTWLDERPAEPFFFFVHTYVVHTPYVAQQPYFEELYGQKRPDSVQSISSTQVPASPQTGWQQQSGLQVNGPNERIETFSPEQQGLLNALYDSGVRAADEAIGQILKKLDEKGLRDRTMVVVTSDHGESLGEHGAAGHYNLYDEVIKVPLLIAWPDGRGKGTKVDTQVRLIDLPATLTDSLGLPPMPESEGVSVLPLLTDPNAEFPNAAESLAASSNQGISLRVGNRQKLIYQHSMWKGTHGRRELFNLADDPLELKNLAEQEPERADVLVHEIAQRYEQKSGNLVIEARNRQDAPLLFRLRGIPVHVFTAKGFESLPDAVEWKGEILVNVPPQKDLRFFLDGHTEGEIVVRLFDPRSADPNVETYAEVMNLEELDQPKTLIFANGWSPSRSEPLSATESGVTLRWQGQRRQQPKNGGPPVDDELRRQLEALGYVK